MGAEELKAKFRRMIDEMWNKGNVDVIDEMYAPHCAFHNPTFPVEGVAGLKEQVRELRAAIPDLHFDVHELIIDGDLSASRWTMGGTPRGEFRGLPATGKTFVMTGMGFSKLEDDRIVEAWTNSDMLGALQQQGIIPAMVAPASSS